MCVCDERLLKTAALGVTEVTYRSKILYGEYLRFKLQITIMFPWVSFLFYESVPIVLFHFLKRLALLSVVENLVALHDTGRGTLVLL